MISFVSFWDTTLVDMLAMEPGSLSKSRIVQIHRGNFSRNGVFFVAWAFRKYSWKEQK